MKEMQAQVSLGEIQNDTSEISTIVREENN